MMSPVSLLKAFLRAVGRVSQGAARHVGQMSLLIWQVGVSTLSGQVSFRSLLNQAYQMGVQSLPLTIVTGMLSGVVTAQQGGYQFTSSIPLYVLGSVVAEGVVLELGPVMTAFVLIGRVGARITAEL